MSKQLYAKIPCATEDEREAISRAMEDKAFRATAIIVGMLLPLRKPEQKRIMEYVQKRVDDPLGWPAVPDDVFA